MQIWTDNKGVRVEVCVVTFVGCAAIIMVDELHTAPGTKTHTYTHIIDPILDYRPKDHRTGIVGQTGTALTNGVDLVLGFADHVIQRVVQKQSTDPGAKALANLKGVDYTTV